MIGLIHTNYTYSFITYITELYWVLTIQYTYLEKSRVGCRIHIEIITITLYDKLYSTLLYSKLQYTTIYHITASYRKILNWNYCITLLSLTHPYSFTVLHYSLLLYCTVYYCTLKCADVLYCILWYSTVREMQYLHYIAIQDCQVQYRPYYCTKHYYTVHNNTI